MREYNVKMVKNYPHISNEYTYAGVFTCFRAWLFDRICVILLGIIWIIAINWGDFLTNLNILRVAEDPKRAAHIVIYSFFLLYLLIVPLFHSSSWQATPGMKLFSCQVVDKNYQKISFIRALCRLVFEYVSYALGLFLLDYMVASLYTEQTPDDYYLILPFLFFLFRILIYIPMFFDRKKRGLHDLVCGTYVIKKPKG